MKLRYDPTVSLGTILHAVALLIAVGTLYGRLVTLETKVDTLWKRSERTIQILYNRLNNPPKEHMSE